jgi:hypothetical protein
MLMFLFIQYVQAARIYSIGQSERTGRMGIQHGHRAWTCSSRDMQRGQAAWIETWIMEKKQGHAPQVHVAGTRNTNRICSMDINHALLNRSEIYNPRNALASASLPNLKYKFPKWNYKINKK